MKILTVDNGQTYYIHIDAYLRSGAKAYCLKFDRANKQWLETSSGKEVPVTAHYCKTWLSPWIYGRTLVYHAAKYVWTVIEPRNGRPKQYLVEAFIYAEDEKPHHTQTVKGKPMALALARNMGHMTHIEKTRITHVKSGESLTELWELGACRRLSASWTGGVRLKKAAGEIKEYL